MRVVVVVALCCLAGCQRESAPTSTQGEALALALFSLPARAPGSLDAALARAQADARARPGKVNSWVDVGELWVLLARERADPGFYLHAGAAADLGLALSPDNVDARRLRASTLVNAHAFREARALCEALLALDPDDARALGLLSDALYELGDIDGALKATERMVTLSDGLPARSRRAWLRFIRGDVAGARGVHEAAITDSVATAEARAFVAADAGNLSFWQGDLASAERAFVFAAQQIPDFGPALVGRARTALARGDPASATALAKTAWQERRSLEAAALLVALMGPGQEALALERDALAHARRADPRSAALWLATRSSAAADLNEARRLVDVELKVHNDPYTYDVASVVALARGELSDARRYSDAALAHGTPDPRLLARGGIIRLAQGDASGRALIKRALAANALFDPVWAPRAQAALGP